MAVWYQSCAIRSPCDALHASCMDLGQLFFFLTYRTNMYRAELAFGGGLHASRESALAWIASLVAPTAAAASPSAVSLGQPPRGCHHDEAATHGGHRSFQVQALPRPPFGGAKLRPWGALPAGTAADELLAEDSPLLASPSRPSRSSTRAWRSRRPSSATRP